MSIVYIPNHNESVYAISERIAEAPEVLIEKTYKSRYSSAVRNEKKQLKSFRKRATMGPAVVQPPDPEHFLRKLNGRQSVPLQNLPDVQNRRFSCSLSAKRPNVPLRNIVLTEQDEKLKHRPKNFISANIDATTNMVPKKPSKIVVVDPTGRKVPLTDGLQPKYIYSKKYGNPPKYIKQRCHHEEKDNISKSDNKEEKLKYIDRDKLLAGLKENWEDLQKEFQKLPLLTDTLSKIIRKQKLENQLKQLEKDILFLEKHSRIYVYNCNKNGLSDA